MTKTELQQATDQVRKFLIESDLDTATEKLLEITKHFGEEEQKEALLLANNWNGLERKIRHSLIQSQEAQIKQNQLVNRIMDFASDLENDRPSPKPEPSPTPPQHETKTSKTPFLIGGLILLGLLAFFLFPENEDDPCQELVEQGENAFFSEDYDKAKIVFTKVTAQCPDLIKGKEWVRRVNQELAKKQTPEPSKPRTYEEITGKPARTQTGNSNPPKEEIITKTDKTEPQNRTQPQRESAPPVVQKEEVPPPAKPTGTFAQYLKSGEKAMKNKRYEKALYEFQQAQNLDDNIAIGRKVNEAIEACYRKYFTHGMDYWNDENYASAKKEFEMAQKYKNTIQIKGMIKKCEQRI